VTVNLPAGADAAAPRDLRVRALIVDDQAPFRAAARSLIRLLRGWEVVGEAASGEEALAWFADGGSGDPVPDVVLMDINLPGINGIEATRRITATAPGTAVVLVSTELDEVLGLADRIAVMYHGRIAGEVPPGTPAEEIGLLMAGHTETESPAAAGAGGTR
jgi:DNA-binding NarL/FixJ family response regulator